MRTRRGAVLTACVTLSREGFFIFTKEGRFTFTADDFFTFTEEAFFGFRADDLFGFRADDFFAAADDLFGFVADDLFGFVADDLFGFAADDFFGFAVARVFTRGLGFGFDFDALFARRALMSRMVGGFGACTQGSASASVESCLVPLPSLARIAALQ